MTPDALYAEAISHGVSHLICVGTDVESSSEAVAFANEHAQAYASVALHPHEATSVERDLENDLIELEKIIHTSRTRLVAIGECGLDYFYHEDAEVIERQKWLLRRHIELGLKFKLPFIFHIRDAFDDFFTILDEYSGITGVVHSFTAGNEALDGCISRGLYVGVNGILTFSKDVLQLEAAKRIPLERMLLETDAPFLTPKPFRGKMCKPEYVRYTAEFLSELQQVPLEEITTKTTQNAKLLFNL